MSYEECIYKARLSEKAERFEQMVECIKEAAKICHEEGKCMCVEERNMLSVAYKNHVGVRRTSWRILTKSLQDEEAAEPNNPMHVNIIQEYIDMVEKELNAICDDILFLLDSYLIKDTNTKDTAVFFLKMKGDYLRYKAEIAGDDLEEISDTAQKAYQSAAEIADASLCHTNPTRLGLYLNYSVFCFEILNERERAMQMSEKAFNSAIKDLESLSERGYKDSTLILQLIRDNMSLWRAESSNEA